MPSNKTSKKRGGKAGSKSQQHVAVDSSCDESSASGSDVNYTPAFTPAAAAAALASNSASASSSSSSSLSPLVIVMISLIAVVVAAASFGDMNSDSAQDDEDARLLATATITRSAACNLKLSAFFNKEESSEGSTNNNKNKALHQLATRILALTRSFPAKPTAAFLFHSLEDHGAAKLRSVLSNNQLLEGGAVGLYEVDAESGSSIAKLQRALLSGDGKKHESLCVRIVTMPDVSKYSKGVRSAFKELFEMGTLRGVSVLQVPTVFVLGTEGEDLGKEVVADRVRHLLTRVKL